MKSLIHIMILLALFAISALPKDKIHNNLFPEKFSNEKQQKVHNANVDVLQRINEIDSLLLKSPKNTRQTALRNPQREFYEEEGFNAKDTRTTINKTQLGDGHMLREEYEQYWDGYAWVNKYRDSYTYDGNNNQAEWLHQDWDGSAWVNRDKYSYTYDGNNNLTEYLDQKWNASDWVNDYKHSYTYDGNNNLTERLEKDWIGSDWKNKWKYSYTYNGNNNLTEWLEQDWIGSHWKNIRKYSYTYDGNNNKIKMLYQRWYGSAWVIKSKFSYTYDGKNNLTEWLEQRWDGSDWVVTGFKFSYAYDGNNNLTEEFIQLWNDDDSAWENIDKYLYTYDSDNKLIERIYQMGPGYVWLNFLKTIYTYDVNNNQIEWLVYRYNHVVFDWEIYYKLTYTYNGNNNLTEWLWQSWDDSTWVNVEKIIYLYLSTDVEEITGEFNDYSLSNNYPNPFNPTTNIQLNISEPGVVSLKVYDILGNKIATLVDEYKPAGSYEVAFDAGNLPSGIYFYQLKVKGFIETKKMILMK